MHHTRWSALGSGHTNPKKSNRFSNYGKRVKGELTLANRAKVRFCMRNPRIAMSNYLKMVKIPCSTALMASSQVSLRKNCRISRMETILWRVINGFSFKTHRTRSLQKILVRVKVGDDALAMLCELKPRPW